MIKSSMLSSSQKVMINKSIKSNTNDSITKKSKRSSSLSSSASKAQQQLCRSVIVPPKLDYNDIDKENSNADCNPFVTKSKLEHTPLKPSPSSLLPSTSPSSLSLSIKPPLLSSPVAIETSVIIATHELENEDDANMNDVTEIIYQETLVSDAETEINDVVGVTNEIDATFDDHAIATEENKGIAEDAEVINTYASQVDDVVTQILAVDANNFGDSVLTSTDVIITSPTEALVVSDADVTATANTISAVELSINKQHRLHNQDDIIVSLSAAAFNTILDNEATKNSIITTTTTTTITTSTTTAAASRSNLKATSAATNKVRASIIKPIINSSGSTNHDILHIDELLFAFREDPKAAENAVECAIAASGGRLLPSEFREYLRAFRSPAKPTCVMHMPPVEVLKLVGTSSIPTITQDITIAATTGAVIDHDTSTTFPVVEKNQVTTSVATLTKLIASKKKSNRLAVCTNSATLLLAAPSLTPPPPASVASGIVASGVANASSGCISDIMTCVEEGNDNPFLAKSRLLHSPPKAAIARPTPIVTAGITTGVSSAVGAIDECLPAAVEEVVLPTLTDVTDTTTPAITDVADGDAVDTTAINAVEPVVDDRSIACMGTFSWSETELDHVATTIRRLSRGSTAGTTTAAAAGTAAYATVHSSVELLQKEIESLRHDLSEQRKQFVEVIADRAILRNRLDEVEDRLAAAVVSVDTVDIALASTPMEAAYADVDVEEPVQQVVEPEDDKYNDTNARIQMNKCIDSEILALQHGIFHIDRSILSIEKRRRVNKERELRLLEEAIHFSQKQSYSNTASTASIRATTAAVLGSPPVICATSSSFQPSNVSAFFVPVPIRSTVTECNGTYDCCDDSSGGYTCDDGYTADDGTSTLCADSLAHPHSVAQVDTVSYQTVVPRAKERHSHTSTTSSKYGNLQFIPLGDVSITSKKSASSSSSSSSSGSGSSCSRSSGGRSNSYIKKIVDFDAEADAAKAKPARTGKKAATTTAVKDTCTDQQEVPVPVTMGKKAKAVTQTTAKESKKRVKKSDCEAVTLDECMRVEDVPTADAVVPSAQAKKVSKAKKCTPVPPVVVTTDAVEERAAPTTAVHVIKGTKAKKSEVAANVEVIATATTEVVTATATTEVVTATVEAVATVASRANVGKAVKAKKPTPAHVEAVIDSIVTDIPTAAAAVAVVSEVQGQPVSNNATDRTIVAVSHKPKLSAYQLYVQAMQPEVTQQNPGVAALGVINIIGRMWAQVSADQKKQYIDMADSCPHPLISNSSSSSALSDTTDAQVTTVETVIESSAAVVGKRKKAVIAVAASVVDAGAAEDDTEAAAEVECDSDYEDIYAKLTSRTTKRKKAAAPHVAKQPNSKRSKVATKAAAVVDDFPLDPDVDSMIHNRLVIEQAFETASISLSPIGKCDADAHHDDDIHVIDIENKHSSNNSKCNKRPSTSSRDDSNDKIKLHKPTTTVDYSMPRDINRMKHAVLDTTSTSTSMLAVALTKKSKFVIPKLKR